MSFSFETVKHVHVEDGAAARLGEIVSRNWKSCSVLVVTDQGLRSIGLLDDALASLRRVGFSPVIYDQVTPDPAEAIVLEAAEIAKSENCGLVIGFGGGSPMDVAKVVAALALGQQQIGDMYGVGNVSAPRLPLVQVPTTAGTGSEVTPIAILTTGETTKMGIVDPVLYADLAVLDATLTLGLPPHATAATAIDAMVHALEAYTSKIKKNPVSDGLALKAFSMLGSGIENVCRDGKNLDARRDMLVGAMMAGQAFANAPVAGVHALAYPLGGHFHVAHGLSNSLVLPHVMKFNMLAAKGYYAELSETVGLLGAERAHDLAKWFADLAVNTGIETRLSEVGVKSVDLDLLADQAMQQTRLLVNNPREITRDIARDIYEVAL